MLLVCTNVDKVGPHVSGTYVMEIVLPFRYFASQGVAMDVATPRGGKAAIYHAGKPSSESLGTQSSAAYIEATQHTLSAAQIDPTAYDGIYFPGGHGQFWDVVQDTRIAAVTAAIHERRGVVGSAGHGTASLVNVRLSNGDHLVARKRMTCFPTWAEKAWMNLSDFGRLLPFDMEDVLRERQADLVVCTRDSANDPTLTLVSDPQHRLVTGSFARGSLWVAEEMLRLIRR
ncbi:DJ-1/PfpI family protein [Roseateles sp.]|uniref:DJ-1/PfpI family protein n=1 Tax=Roseateles sp. TaxID=1971397 RepID=UPI0039E982B0